MANGRCRMHGGKAPGAAKGNSKAFKHGRYSADAVAERRDLMALLRDMKGLVLRARTGEVTAKRIGDEAEN